ncbi:MAG: hypothetical protein HYV63_17435 [Candidatus Schekmanbacteria bacterium]|nr:hypothetical protein [Candidatus Schekmanbacteria bacterium]
MNEVTLSYRKPRLVRIKARNEEAFARAVAKRQLTVLLESEVSRIDEDAVVLTVPSGSLLLPNTYVFICIGGEPPLDLLKQAGARFP